MTDVVEKKDENQKVVSSSEDNESESVIDVDDDDDSDDGHNLNGQELKTLVPSTSYVFPSSENKLLPVGFIKRGPYFFDSRSKERLYAVIRKNGVVLDIVYLDGEVLYTVTSIILKNDGSDVMDFSDTLTKSSKIYFKIGDDRYEFTMRKNNTELLLDEEYNLVLLAQLDYLAFSKITPSELRKKLLLFNFSGSEIVVVHPFMEHIEMDEEEKEEKEGTMDGTNEECKEDNILVNFSESEKNVYTFLKDHQKRQIFYVCPDMAFIIFKLALLKQSKLLRPKIYYHQAIYFLLESALLDKMNAQMIVNMAKWVEEMKSNKDSKRTLSMKSLEHIQTLLNQEFMELKTDLTLVDLFRLCITFDLRNIPNRKHYVNVILRTVNWIMNKSVTEQGKKSFSTSLQYFYKKRKDFLSKDIVTSTCYPISILKNLRPPHKFEWIEKIPEEGFVYLDYERKQFLAADYLNLEEKYKGDIGKYFRNILLGKNKEFPILDPNYVQPKVYNYYAFDYHLLSFLFGFQWFSVLSEKNVMRENAEKLLMSVEKDISKIFLFLHQHLDPNMNSSKNMRDTLINLSI